MPLNQGGLGNRTYNEMNSAFLAKIGWLMLKEEDAFWVKVLKEKYIKEFLGINSFEHKPYATKLWKGLISLESLLRKGLCVSIGIGLSTSFWNDVWLGELALSNQVTQTIPSNLIHLSVA